jgi:hypothetical protein
MAVRRARGRTMGSEEVDLDTFEARTSPSPEEQVLTFEHITRSAEALQRLKPNEVRALWLKAAGNSYAEICEQTGWTYTKVNRCLAEGRKRFLECYAGSKRARSACAGSRSCPRSSTAKRRASNSWTSGPHLRNCGACQATIRELHAASSHLSAVLPASLLFTATEPPRAGDALPHAHLGVDLDDPQRPRGVDRHANPGPHRDGHEPQSRRRRRLGRRNGRRRPRSRGTPPTSSAHSVVRQASHTAAPPPRASKPTPVSRPARSVPVNEVRRQTARLQRPAPSPRSTAHEEVRSAEPLIEPVNGSGDPSTAGGTTSTQQTVRPSTKPLSTFCRCDRIWL